VTTAPNMADMLLRVKLGNAPPTIRRVQTLKLPASPPRPPANDRRWASKEKPRYPSESTSRLVCLGVFWHTIVHLPCPPRPPAPP
jgi:hypothetical protein